jgi:DNA polymerase
MAQKEGQWKRVHTYGGKLTENACQATSRELLVPAMLRAEEAGYPIVLSVYDEIVAEVPEGHGSKEEFIDLMKGPLPAWANDWPIGVDAWIGKRYCK